MAIERASWQGYVFVAIGIFFIVVTIVLFSIGRLTVIKLLTYDAVSLVVVFLGVVYVIFSRKLARQTKPNEGK